MKTSFKIIQLNFTHAQKQLAVGHVNLQSPYIHLSEIEDIKEKGCLFTKAHTHIQTHFDFTGTTDCTLMCFNKKMEFITVRYYRNHQNAPFSFLISETYILVLPMTHGLPTLTLTSMELLEHASTKGFHHIFATDAEKVEILATNPYRFYISEQVWIFRGKQRLQMLDDIAKKAIAENNEALYIRITEVKAQLQNLKDY